MPDTSVTYRNGAGEDPTIRLRPGKIRPVIGSTLTPTSYTVRAPAGPPRPTAGVPHRRRIPSGTAWLRASARPTASGTERLEPAPAKRRHEGGTWQAARRRRARQATRARRQRRAPPAPRRETPPTSRA